MNRLKQLSILILVCLNYLCVSQSIHSKIEFNAGPIYHLDVAKDGSKILVTTADRIILWDDHDKKVLWKTPHDADVYYWRGDKQFYPGKAALGIDGVYQVRSESDEIFVLNKMDGSLVKKVQATFDDTGAFRINTLGNVPGESGKFIINGFRDTGDGPKLFNIGNDQFLIKDLKVDQLKFGPNGKYISARYRYERSFSSYALDQTRHFENADMPLRARYRESNGNMYAILAATDGKHTFRAWMTGSYNYVSQYQIDKIFGLTKKILGKFNVPFKPIAMDYFGNSGDLLLFTEKEYQSSWFVIDADSWSKREVNLDITGVSELFNDAERNRVFAADKEGNLWTINTTGTTQQISIHTSTGESKEVYQQNLQAAIIEKKSTAQQQADIAAINRDRTDPKTNPDYYFQKANEYSANRNYAAAEASMKRVYDVSKDMYVSVSYMAWFKLLNSKPAEAQKLSLVAYGMIGFDPLAPTIVSYTYAVQNDLTNAKEYIKIAVGNTVENKDLTAITPDLDILKGIGYPGASLDALDRYYESLYKSELSQRAALITKFQNAQRQTNANSRLSAFESVIREEGSLSAPRTEILGAAYAEAASASRNKGNVHQAQKYGQKAVELLQPYGQLGLLTGALVNAGHAHNAGDKKDKAIDYYERALKIINEIGGDLVNYKDAVLNGLGGAYQDIGEFNRALTYYEDALEVAKKSGRKIDQGIALGNIATVYIEQGENVSNAINLLKQGESIYRSNGDKKALANNYNNLGFGYLLLGKLNEAVDAFRQAETIYTQLGMRSGQANVNKNIGKMLMMLDKKIEAITYYKKAAQNVNEREDPSMAMSIYANLAGAELGQEQYASAAVNAQKAIQLNEQLVSQASGKTKRGLLSSTNNYYRILSLAHFRSGQYGKSFEAHEKNRSRVMLAKLGGGSSVLASTVQASLKPNEALIDYNVVHMHWEVNSHLFPIVIDTRSVSGKEFNDSTLIADLKQEGEATFTAYMKGERSMLKQIREFVQEKGVPDNVAQSFVRDANLEITIEFYRHLIKNPTPTNEVLRKSYARVFYDLLIGNIKDKLAGKTDLIIIPDGPLAFLPFETLLDENDKYLAETYKIRYIQSATILNKLGQRNYASSRKPLLAFGGPVFEEMSSKEVSMYRGGDRQVDFNDLQKTYYAAEESGGSMRPTYIQMGFTKMNPLPGTIYETNQIKSIVTGADLYQNDQASENQFKSLASSNALKNYKVLHFATHGWAYNEIPELSTIVLGQYATPKGNEDGYLRVPEIEKLNLNADFVNLSACETALGRLYSSEGVVGLTQAFLVAGAKGISVTQWTVSDEGTAIFMSEMYRKVFQQGQLFLDAIAATKIEFIEGKYGKRFQHPDYWGPFVYYGI